MNSDENRHNHNHFLKTLDLLPEMNRRVRIADILADEGGRSEFHGGESSDSLAVDFDMSGVVSHRRRGGLSTAAASLQCASPRRIISRCLAALRPAARERKGPLGGLECEGVSVLANCSTNLPSSVDSPVLAPDSDDSVIISGRCRTDSSFNLGVACGLLYLIGTSRNEMTKMVEVRKQMEMLLQNFRDELQNKNSPFKTIETNLARSTNSEPQISAQTNSPWTTSYVVPESETILECDRDSSQCVDELDQRRVAEMDELEAELEAELELLEINLDTGHSSKIPNQRSLKVVVDSCSSSSASHSTSSGEIIIIDPREIRTEMNSEVSPIELERKLHELLEARQQERIQELEDALECTKIKLREKELEVSWWKDTARIISHHVPESPRSFSQKNPKSLQLLR